VPAATQLRGPIDWIGHRMRVRSNTMPTLDQVQRVVSALPAVLSIKE